MLKEPDAGCHMEEGCKTRWPCRWGVCRFWGCPHYQRHLCTRPRADGKVSSSTQTLTTNLIPFGGIRTNITTINEPCHNLTLPWVDSCQGHRLGHLWR
eukprot:jgi/Mesvir1/7909/Mv25292-RA.1